MAHQITSTDNVISANETPLWHGLGKLLPGHCTPQQIMEHGVMDWDVIEGELQATTPDGRTYRLTQRALIRSDTRKILGVVGKDYHIVQNHELCQLAADVAGEGVSVETAGSLRGGERVWILLGGETYYVAGVDPIEQYGLFANGHGGNYPVRVLPTTKRVCCANTLAASGVDDFSRGTTVRHTSKASERIAEMRRVLTQNGEELKKFNAIAEDLASKEIDTKWIIDYFRTAYLKLCRQTNSTLPSKIKVGTPDKEAAQIVRANKKSIVILDNWKKNFDEEDSHQKIRRTAWTAFNSITKWSDHQKVVRGESKDESLRTYSNLFGQSSRFKGTALKVARELITA